ncbi:MAG: hypothetical protein EKK65_08830 [Lysobacterales bacterium]|jgi:hypothetical protein|nr:MAG: hypothetical protein EKK65_08830 [Xanthomonadales bacterium]
MSEVDRLRQALQAIVDFEPSDDLPEITHNPDACDECKTWAARKHPIQHACDTWYREYYRREDARKHAYNTQHYDMREIARAALRVG